MNFTRRAARKILLTLTSLSLFSAAYGVAAQDNDTPPPDVGSKSPSSQISHPLPSGSMTNMPDAPPHDGNPPPPPRDDRNYKQSDRDMPPPPRDDREGPDGHHLLPPPPGGPHGAMEDQGSQDGNPPPPPPRQQ